MKKIFAGLALWNIVLVALKIWAAWHRWVAYLAVAYNLYVFWVEYRVIPENNAMICEINAKITGS